MPVAEYPKIETLFDRGPDHKVILGQVRCPEFLQVARWLVTEKVDGTNIRVAIEKEPVYEQVTTYDDFGPGLMTQVKSYDWRVRFYGRTDDAQIPTFLLSYLQDTFTLEKMQELWHGKTSCPDCHGSGQYDSGEPRMLTRSRPGHRAYQCECVEPYPLVLYGEGYGPKIQKGGGNYRDDVAVRLFDVLVGGKWWLDFANVCNVADRLGVKRVPVFPPEQFEEIAKALNGSFLDAVVLLVSGSGFNSAVAQEDRPGLNWDETWIPGEGVVARTDPYLYDKHGRPLRWKLKTKDFPA